MAQHTVIQGDSYFLDFKTASYPTFDVNWTGSWSIVDALGSAGSSVASGSLAISSDSKFLEMRIAPADTEAIPPGDYYLVVQVENTTLSFRREIVQETLEITDQGIPAP